MKQPDKTNDNYKKELIKHKLSIAKEDLDTALLTYNSNQLRCANNRAYYSIFHTICAILAYEGVAFKKHKDVLAYFNKNYVKTCIFPRELGRKIVIAEDIRHASDYDSFYIASKETTLDQINTAKLFIELAENYLTDNNML